MGLRRLQYKVDYTFAARVIPSRERGRPRAIAEYSGLDGGKEAKRRLHEVPSTGASLARLCALPTLGDAAGDA
jgi:hypothetical protein